MQITITFTIYYIVVSLIKSIGKKWNNELREIWEYSLKSYLSWVWIPLIIDAIMNITIFLIRK